MRLELITELHQQLKTTMIYVTHDQVEAMTMADRIVVLNAGRCGAVRHPARPLQDPANRFVAGFIGSPKMNMLAGTVSGGGVLLEGGTLVPLPGRTVPLAEGAPVTLGIRPEHVEVRPGPLKLAVATTEVLGSETIVHATTAGAGAPLTVALRGISGVKAGDSLEVDLPAAFIHLFDEAGTTIGATEDWRAAYLT
jgi:multiple sugar transport system ATP-binding protein